MVTMILVAWQSKAGSLFLSLMITKHVEIRFASKRSMDISAVLLDSQVSDHVSIFVWSVELLLISRVNRSVNITTTTKLPTDTSSALLLHIKWSVSTHETNTTTPSIG